MKFLKMKKSVALATSVVVVAIAAVGAYAYFTSTGTGSGTATVGTDGGFTVAQDAFDGPGPATVTLYPANGVQDLTGTVTNAGSGNQNLAQIVATIQAPTGPNVNGTPACTAADFELVDSDGTWDISGVNNGVATANAVSGSDLPENLDPAEVHEFSGLSVQMIDNGLNQDSCKLATVNIKYDAS